MEDNHNCASDLSPADLYAPALSSFGLYTKQFSYIPVSAFKTKADPLA